MTGSTDNSLKIIETLALKDKRIIIINKPNSGYGVSMNEGFNKITGDYFMVVEPDDWLELNTIETLINEIENFDVLISFCFIKHEQNGITYRNYLPFKNGCLYEYDTSYYDIIFKPKYCYTWNRLYKTNFVKKNLSMPWPNTPGACFQDQYFNYKLLIHKPNIKFIHFPFYNYRIHGNNSICNNENVKFHLIHCYESLKNKFVNINDIEYWFNLFTTNNLKFQSFFKKEWNKYLSLFNLMMFFGSPKFTDNQKKNLLNLIQISESNEKYIIIANARDEEYYIKEWVDYHLNLGFDEIHLFINDDIQKYSFLKSNNKIKLYNIDNALTFT